MTLDGVDMPLKSIIGILGFLIQNVISNILITKLVLFFGVGYWND